MTATSEAALQPSPLNLIYISDAYRRGLSEYQDTAHLVRLTRELACLVTYLYPEYPIENHVNQDALQEIAQKLEDIAAAAAEEDFSTVTLPFGGNRENAHICFIQDGILNTRHFPVQFSFVEDGDYNTDLSSIGPIDPDIHTILDSGLRGLAPIDDDLKRKWDNEVKIGDTFALPFEV